MGNHEERWNAYLNSRAEELADLDDFRFEKIFHLDSLGIVLVSSKTITHFGKLSVLHGHETGKSFAPPVNAARGLYLKTKESSLCSHVHNTSSHTEKTLNNNIITCWSTGCLSELNPDYAPVNRYNHGFAEVFLDEDGRFEVKNYTIINGRIY